MQKRGFPHAKSDTRYITDTSSGVLTIPRRNNYNYKEATSHVNQRHVIHTHVNHKGGDELHMRCTVR